MLLSGCLSQTDGEGEGLIETSQSDQRSTAQIDPHSLEFIALVYQPAGRKPSLRSPSQTA